MLSTKNSLGLRTLDIATLTKMIKSGLSYEVLRRFQKRSALSLATLSRAMQIPMRTLARRKRAARLTRQESERLLRLAALYDKTVELFEGDSADPGHY